MSWRSFVPTFWDVLQLVFSNFGFINSLHFFSSSYWLLVRKCVIALWLHFTPNLKLGQFYAYNSRCHKCVLSRWGLLRYFDLKIFLFPSLETVSKLPHVPGCWESFNLDMEINLKNLVKMLNLKKEKKGKGKCAKAGLSSKHRWYWELIRHSLIVL